MVNNKEGKVSLPVISIIIAFAGLAILAIWVFRRADQLDTEVTALLQFIADEYYDPQLRQAVQFFAETGLKAQAYQNWREAYLKVESLFLRFGNSREDIQKTFLISDKLVMEQLNLTGVEVIHGEGNLLDIRRV